ncbi:dienelactone hydrolase family protein [Chitiniphilus eburneus]|uniref:Dienelactone hydrolase family protein n=1 Tax=Chitiniphilus eburneus TaxID=2571148 RepID=A0A4V5MS55_9NEIS|nr:dienelactone hydrolase family protein [Chitiniphilus eburneus]TJZ78898.1 dienelactone hydrolase family protein [Chitiniphilus eburneus]
MPDQPTSFLHERRGFLAAALATGFALAVRPVAASTIVTDSDGLEVGPAFIERGDVELPAYVARPANASGPLPTVIVVQEIFGVHEHIQDLCRRLAKAGYLAIAPDLYFRQGDPRKYTDIETLQREVVTKVPDAQVMGDLDGMVAWAAAHGGDPARVALTGFCWGGRIAWLYAAHNPALKAIVAWYGRVEGKASDNTPLQPIDVAAQLKVPVLGLYGGKDQGIPLDGVERMRVAIKRSARPSRIVVYEDAGHGFNADYRPSYHRAAAQDGWLEMTQWFKRHGV